MPSEVIVCDGNGSVRCSSKSQVNVDVIENGWIVKDEILDILHVVVENGGVREREMCVSLDLTRMSSAISGRGVTAGSSAPPTATCAYASAISATVCTRCSSTT